jgi:transcriptional regulator of acetoin/glycerol metabolism
MATDSAAEIRRRLDALGKRRAAQAARDEELTEEVKQALRDAYGVVTVEEAAERLKMHRTTVYRVYKPHG